MGVMVLAAQPPIKMLRPDAYDVHPLHRLPDFDSSAPEKDPRVNGINDLRAEF